MAYPITYGHSKGVLVIFLLMSKGRVDARKKSEVLQGTLDLMILKHSRGWGHCTDSESPVASSS